MRILKYNLLLTVLVLASLSSCSKDTAKDPLLVDNSLIQPNALTSTTALADIKVEPTALPQVILDYLATNYASSTIIKSELENNGHFEVKLNTGQELVFGADGAFLGVDDDTNGDFGDTLVETATLSQVISDYVATNFTGLSITSASLENNGHYEVELNDGSELVFDGNGGFLGIGIDEGDGNDFEDESESTENDTAIDVGTLPQTVKDYVATNYTSSTISRAKLKSNGQYEVYLSTGEELYFDAQGLFLQVDTDSNNQNEDGTIIDAASLPQITNDYLSTNYPAATIVEVRLMADRGFEVEISTGDEVVFDANGTFVKIENKNNEDGE
tara:strand:+ start:441 stop:1427 length:987 start_codon:yes stop_codon:yes gene_type:complete